MRQKRSRALRPTVDRLDDRCLLSGLSPQQLQTAYGLQNLKFNDGGFIFPGDGSGHTIAIIDVAHDPYLYSDLATFDATYGISTPAPLGWNAPGAPWFYQANFAGAQTNDGWAQEETLDVEAAHAMAPGANILVIEAASDSLPDLITAIQAARNTAGVSVVSMSFGVNEFAGENVYDSLFTTPPGHAGITFIASSGDAPGPEWPASSPNVLSVGGTTLLTTASGAYAGESAWTSGGGGLSVYEPEPAYQFRVQLTGRRSIPDVAFEADPNTGITVFTTTPSTGRASWSVFGGTSVGAPYWAGIMAVVDEGYALAHIVGSLDGATQALPILYSRPANVFNVVNPVTYTAGAGRHRVTVTTLPLTTTGLGSPNGSFFITLMLGYQMPAFNGATPNTSVRTAVQVAATPPSNGTPSIRADVLAGAVAPAFTTLVLPLGAGQGIGVVGQVPVSSVVVSGSSFGTPRPLLSTAKVASTPILQTLVSISSGSTSPMTVTSSSAPSPRINPGKPALLAVSASKPPLGSTIGLVLTPGGKATIAAPDTTTPLLFQNAPRVFDPTDAAGGPVLEPG
jgi:Subtilase family